MLDCEICGAPAEVKRSMVMSGTDFDGQDALFEVVKIECAAGHWYDELRNVVK